MKSLAITSFLFAGWGVLFSLLGNAAAAAAWELGFLFVWGIVYYLVEYKNPTD